jgi:hypothetical protein
LHSRSQFDNSKRHSYGDYPIANSINDQCEEVGINMKNTVRFASSALGVVAVFFAVAGKWIFSAPAIPTELKK